MRLTRSNITLLYYNEYTYKFFFLSGKGRSILLLCIFFFIRGNRLKCDKEIQVRSHEGPHAQHLEKNNIDPLGWPLINPHLCIFANFYKIILCRKRVFTIFFFFRMFQIYILHKFWAHIYKASPLCDKNLDYKKNKPKKKIT